MNEKITFHQLGNKLSELTGGTQTTSELFVKEFFATVTEALQRDGIVKIKNFGTFILSDIDGEKKVKFAPDKDIAEAINMPFSCFEAVELNDEVTDEILNVHEQDECLPENPFVSVAVESETSDAGQPITDDELRTTNSESDCTAAEAEDSPLSSADNEDNTPDETHMSTLKDEEPETYEPEYEPDDFPEEVSGKHRWTVSVLCLIAGLVAGYLLYPIINQNNVPADKTTDTAIADAIEIFSNDIFAKSTEDSVKIATTPDSVNIIKPVVVYDTIGKNRFLTTMSREYYGRMEFWVYIYEENKANLGNPNRIKPGTAIIIPPADKYGIDKNNPDCIDKAKLKAMEIYAPYEK